MSHWAGLLGKIQRNTTGTLSDLAGGAASLVQGNTEQGRAQLVSGYLSTQSGQAVQQEAIIQTGRQYMPWIIGGGILFLLFFMVKVRR